jgi:hypothetical protein
VEGIKKGLVKESSSRNKAFAKKVLPEDFSNI